LTSGPDPGLWPVF